MAFDFPSTRLSDNGTEFYALGGITVEIQPKIGSTYAATWANLGPIANFQEQPAIEIYEHFDGRSGTRTKDFELVTSKSYSFTFTVEEMNPMVMSSLLLASAYAEPGTTTAVTNEAVTLDANGYGRLKYVPLGTPAPVVTNVAGSTTYVANTDYIISVAPDGGAYVIRNPGGAITAGQTLHVDYSYNSGELVFMPLTVNEIDCKPRITFRSGNTADTNWRFEHTRASLKPTGNVSVNLTEVSTAEFTLTILYDASAQYTVAGTPRPAPFGYRRYGISL